ncbi:MAG: phosphate starvation-inducible protein PhoH [Kordiimonas sp.]|nr:phosphate starvation-inducible protein PhoH [Kordiimonas sp.]|tara:strand:- start:575 stop:1324 length:750 start_codon:yes stop_codon:yes gene_type:complete
MGKKSRRAATPISEKQKFHSSTMRPLYKDQAWDPLETENREKRYLRKVRPQSDNQRELMEAIDKYNLCVAIGPAGTGKTYLAVAKAVEALEAGDVGRILLSRPAVEAGENLGFLPGDLDEKLAPYLRPLYDALGDRLGLNKLKKYLQDGTIEIAPVAYMRGRTLNNSFIVVDEAQNCTYGQLKMLLTRLGWNSTMVLTGDPDQSDLLNGLSGFGDIASRLSQLDDVRVVSLEEQDIVRHPLVASMLTVI